MLTVVDPGYGFDFARPPKSVIEEVGFSRGDELQPQRIHGLRSIEVPDGLIAGVDRRQHQVIDGRVAGHGGLDGRRVEQVDVDASHLGADRLRGCHGTLLAAPGDRHRGSETGRSLVQRETETGGPAFEALHTPRWLGERGGPTQGRCSDDDPNCQLLLRTAQGHHVGRARSRLRVPLPGLPAQNGQRVRGAGAVPRRVGGSRRRVER